MVVALEPGGLDAAVPDGVADERWSQNCRHRPAPWHPSVRFAGRADRAPASRAGNGSCNGAARLAWRVATARWRARHAPLASRAAR